MLTGLLGCPIRCSNAKAHNNDTGMAAISRHAGTAPLPPQSLPAF